MASIQRLRARARSDGYLATNRYQHVYLDSGYIYVDPVQPRYIYVPEYDPQIVYMHRRSSANEYLISFGLGLLIGVWLDRDCDWHHHRVFYHGWNGGGWIRNSRSYVSVNNGYYVNNDYRNRPIAVDRRVRTRDLGDYRSKLRNSVGSYKVPESRRPSGASTVRNRNMQAKPSAAGRSVPSIAQKNRGTNRGKALSRSTGRANKPSARTVRKSSRSVASSNARTRKSVTRRSSTGRANRPSVRTARKSSRSVTRLKNARSHRGVTRRSSLGRTNRPSVRSAPRQNRSNTRSNAGPSQGATRSRGSSGSNHAPARSNSRSNGKDKSRNDSKGR